MTVALTAPELRVVLGIEGTGMPLPGAAEVASGEFEPAVLKWASSALVARGLVEPREGELTLHPLLGALLAVIRRAERHVAAFGATRGQPIRPFIVSVRGTTAVTHEVVAAGIHAVTLYADREAAIDRLEEFCATQIDAEAPGPRQEVTDVSLASATAISHEAPVERISEILRSGGLEAELAAEIGGALAEGGMVTTVMAFEGTSPTAFSSFTILAGTRGSWVIDDASAPGSRVVAGLSSASLHERATALLPPDAPTTA